MQIGVSRPGVDDDGVNSVGRDPGAGLPRRRN